MSEIAQSIKIDAAIKYRISALVHTWRSSACWKRYDAQVATDPQDARACISEAQAYEQCADNLQITIKEWPKYSPIRAESEVQP